jgi:predicted RNA-binding Zn ribbon-like protein
MVVGASNAPLIGGALCLDFANTVDARFPRPGEQPPEYLGSYEDLIVWSRRSGALGASRARRLLREWGDQPPARAALADAVELREAIFEFFSALCDRASPPRPAAERLRTFAARAIEHGELCPVRGSTAFAWRWEGLDPRLMLWPISLSATSLATSEDVQRLRRCPGQDGRCGWLFLDRTKNGGRRWCSMQMCGNPVKARRQQQHRQALRAAQRASGQLRETGR